MTAQAPSSGDEILGKLRELRKQLTDPETQEQVNKQDELLRRKFAGLLLDVNALIGQMENKQLAAIADDLDRLAPDFKAGIANLRELITKMDGTISVLNGIDTALGLVARVAALI